jgi:gluconokinase
VGRALAERLGWAFVDADDLHSPENKAKMHRGEALTDADRAPWLAALQASIDEWLAAKRSTVLACSALKRRYRDTLRGHGEEGAVRIVLLDVPAATLAARLRGRSGHFAGESLLASQLATLERPDPAEALVVDGSPTPAEIVTAIVGRLGL